ncbi:hypothetical protein GCM10011376_23140 [Nocardioides flavus (ex Wang et al. 2016)]|uniref:Uncharacterized protein n=1 Tax=Nocardioides flavus (ex Wang et al. 2016) TaxID=2058780 RepID=A0ABQ3HNJ8_9ACTN|nr:hypothetical protein [Nocardioides flavus (ex Wang et al. 2016)]GHE17704.1 hypothetical protein GCM10011376_23140 [Nocardioides flavus (ex Wang et al. 2016)]
MNPIRTATGLIQLPAHAAAAAAGTAAGVATTGVRTTARVLGWVAGRVTGPPAQQSPWATRTDSPRQDSGVAAPGATRTPAPPASAGEETPATAAPATAAPAAAALARKAPAKKAPAKKAPAKKARKAPSKKAAVVAPALGLTEAEAEDVLRTPSRIPAAGDGINPDTTETDLHQPGTEPLMDPATVKAVASEAEVLQRAADPDKG